MKTTSILTAVFAAGILLTTSATAVTIDLETPSLGVATHAEDWRPNGGFSSGGAFFNNAYDSQYGSWGGFALSRASDTASAGFGNQYSSFSGSGFGGSSQFAVGYLDTYNAIYPTITLPSYDIPLSIRITNTTYSALSMRDGDSFAKKFGGLSGNDPDWFKVIITGVDAGNTSTGSVDFYLADFRFNDNAQDYIVNTWENVDLTSLSSTTRSLKFDFASSDVGMFGVKTPTYVAVDNLTTTVPEPATAACLLLGTGMLFLRRRR